MAKGCRNEFPYFGASYPDARCINGYLWDLDSEMDGELTSGGEVPCPFCNTDTKHLVGKAQDCPEYYKWWEE